MLLATDINSESQQYQQDKNRNDSQKEQQFIILLNIIRTYSDVLFSAISNIKSLVIQINDNISTTKNYLESRPKLKEEVTNICKDIIEECNYRLNIYEKYKLLTI